MHLIRRRLIRLLATLAVLASPAALAQLSEEVPFVTSPDNVTLEMLRIAKVGPGDHVIDLGSGDGRIVIVAARQFGATGLGVEIDPQLVQRSIKNARDAGVADRVAFREQDLFATDLSRASVVTMYLLPAVNLQLRPRLLTLKPGIRLVSHDWDMGDWKPDQTSVLPVPDKSVGREKSSKVHLWIVPARFAGLWCGSGPLREFSLRLAQQYQDVKGTLTRKDRVRAIEGRARGTLLRTQATRNGALLLELAGSDLRVTGSEGALTLPRGATFQRVDGGACPG